MQMLVALKPLHDVARIRRINVATYQSVSGTGQRAIEELLTQTHAILENKTPLIKFIQCKLHLMYCHILIVFKKMVIPAKK